MRCIWGRVGIVPLNRLVEPDPRHVECIAYANHPRACVSAYLRGENLSPGDRLQEGIDKSIGFGIWEWRDIITGASWEPYGGLRAYYANAQTRNDTGPRPAAVEYLLGDDGTSPPSEYCNAARPSAGDHTGRLRALWVSTGAVHAGTGDIYKRTYSWRADQVERQYTCLLTRRHSSRFFSHSPVARP